MNPAPAPPQPLDAVVIGGGPAGLSAALVLGRARRPTLVLDAGQPRNAPSPAVHGVFSHDGTSPHGLLDAARTQLTAYPSVAYRRARALAARHDGECFVVHDAEGTAHRARRLLLASGVQDVLPSIDGLAALWGTGVLHCGYCHAWEVRDEPLALYAPDAQALPTAMTLVRWSRDLLLCTGGSPWPDAGQRELLDRNGIRLKESPLRRVEGALPRVTLVFADGTAESRRALFVTPALTIDRAIPDALGCEYADPARIAVRADGRTSATGVYAAGDLAAGGGQVMTAAATGAAAAMTLNADLAREEFLGAVRHPAAALPGRASSA